MFLVQHFTSERSRLRDVFCHPRDHVLIMALNNGHDLIFSSLRKMSVLLIIYYPDIAKKGGKKSYCMEAK